MSLEKHLIAAFGGFVSGFSLGISGFIEKPKEEFDGFKYLSEGVGNSDSETVKEMESKLLKRENKLKFVLPWWTAMTYEGLEWFLSGDLENFLDTSIASIPAAYVGRFIGGSARKIIKNSGLSQEQLKIRKQIKSDPANAISYLPIEKQDLIGRKLKDLEQITFETDEPLPEDDFVSFMEETCSKLNEDFQVYGSEVMVNFGEKMLKSVERGTLKNAAKRFWDDESDESSLVFLGVGDVKDFRIYDIVGGESLFVYDFKRENFKIKKSGQNIEASGDFNMNLLNETYFDRSNCLPLNQLNRADGSCVIMKSPPGMPVEFKTQIILQTYGQKLIPYLKNDESL